MKRFLLSAIVALLSVGCVNDNLGDIPSNTPLSSKIRNSCENAVKGQLLVYLEEGTESLTIDGLDLDVKALFPGTKSEKLARWQKVKFDKELNLESVAEQIAAQEGVKYVEYDILIKRIKSESLPMPTSRPQPTRATKLPFDDPELPYQWHYYNDGSLASYFTCKAGADINLLNAWKYTAGDNRIIVAVIDGGIKVDHPDLEDNIWTNEAEYYGTEGIDDDGNGYVDDIHGYNFLENTGNITADPHGTHVAGTIAAVNNNGYAVCGIAGGTGKGDGVRLMSLQVFANSTDADGGESAEGSAFAAAFVYAADNGAVLVNNSWGYGGGAYENFGMGADKAFAYYDYYLKQAIDYYEENAGLEGVIDGGLAIFASGNETWASSAHPGAYYRYISVSAMSSDYTATYYTNYGPGCNITAPGGNSIYGTMACISSTSTDLSQGGYEYMQGTSMACPHVTGCAALALSYAAKRGYKLTADELRTLILTSTHDINKYQTGYSEYFDFDLGGYYNFSLEPYKNKMGSGYIDAHKLLMQLDSTPCLYISTDERHLLPLNEYFGNGYESLTYYRYDISSSDVTALGITEYSITSDGHLDITCTKPGTCRISITAIIGGTSEGGEHIGGMLVEREVELVVRESVALNGGWL